MPIFYLSGSIQFPPPRLAEKGGLIAVGGDLGIERLLSAYENGIFPWYSEGDPILWWSPDPRLVLYPKNLRVSKSLFKILKKGVFTITLDQSFEQVIHACAENRAGEGKGTWIVKDMIKAYCRLHRAGYAHSVEAWYDGNLAGGLYGVALGRCFFGESMFTRVSNASKAALAALVEDLDRQGFHLIDCQMTTPHLLRLGAEEIPRARFLKELEKAMAEKLPPGSWHRQPVSNQSKEIFRS
jgi:leucyl/phenylalanyl-tRNA--protein transferase